MDAIFFGLKTRLPRDRAHRASSREPHGIDGGAVNMLYALRIEDG
jgi:hypothetical protein